MSAPPTSASTASTGTTVPGNGLVVIPGATPGQSVTRAGVPGAHNDGSDFYGLAAAVLVIVAAIAVVRRLVPLRRGRSSVAQRPSSQTDHPATDAIAPSRSPSTGAGAVDGERFPDAPGTDDGSET